MRRVFEIVTGDDAGAVTGVETGADVIDTAMLTSSLGQTEAPHFATHGLPPLSSQRLPAPSLATSFGDTGRDAASAAPFAAPVQ